MRINLESGLPVVVSDVEQVYPATSGPVVKVNPMREAHMGRLALKRVLRIWYMPTVLGHSTGWTKAYGNPFIHGSFLNWYRDDPTYHRTAEREALSFSAIGTAVIVDPRAE